MSSDIVRLTLGDWQWNAAIVGFINILGEENINAEADTVEFSAEALDGFEDKYFAYFINTYEKTLSWFRIVSFKDRLRTYEESNFEGFDLKALQTLNTYLKDVKRYIKSNSYKAAYKLIDLNLDMLALEKELTSIKKPKNLQEFEVKRSKVIAEVKKNLDILHQIIEYCDSPSGKRYIAAKNVIYTIINKAWNGVSFLNPQTKEKDCYADYKKYFVNTATEYLQRDKSKYTSNCFICDAPMQNMNNDLSFLNATGFDVARKSSHVWNFQNDIAICPLCKLIYSCLPAGITYIFDKGIYVNANIDLKNAVRINYKIKSEILRLQEGNLRSIYHALVIALHEQENESARYELADVQVVRYENDSYRFNILSRGMLRIITESKKALNGMIQANFAENGMTVQIYDEVIGRIFNNQNLFTLIHRMLYCRLSNVSKCYFHDGHVRNVLEINQKILMNLGGIEMENDLVKSARTAGYYLRKGYISKGAENKMPGICYRLLNALKTSNADMFMNVVLNCYLYVGDQVPKVITNALGQDKGFSTMGYAFVSGLINGKGENKNTEKKG